VFCVINRDFGDIWGIHSMVEKMKKIPSRAGAKKEINPEKWFLSLCSNIS